MEVSLEDKYLFDLNGYIVVRGVLTSEAVSEMNAVIDRKSTAMLERCAELRNTSAGSVLEGDGLSCRKDLGGILEWGEDSRYFREILDHPTLVPYFHSFLGKGFRMVRQFWYKDEYIMKKISSHLIGSSTIYNCTRQRVGRIHAAWGQRGLCNRSIQPRNSLLVRTRKNFQSFACRFSGAL